MAYQGRRSRWSHVAGIAIVVILAVLLLYPFGGVGRWIASTYRGWDEARVSRSLNESIDAPGRIGANRSLVPGPSTFDSSELPQLTHTLSAIVGGFFLPDSGIALVERTEVSFVDMASGETTVFGREGGGPLEFRHIRRALRSPQGIALQDIYRLRVVFLDNRGEFVGDMRYHDVPFKGRTMLAPPVAVHPDGRIVFGWDGGEVGLIPMPQAVRPSRDRVRAVREYRANAPSRSARRLSKVWTAEQMARFSTEPLDMDNWPVNELAPPIDQLFVDFDERLWVRDYHFADQDSVTWRVWDMERFTPLFQVRLTVDEELLDATGDVVLLRREDELDVPRAVVSRLDAGRD